MKKYFSVMMTVSIGFISLPKISMSNDDIVPGSRFTSARGAAMGDAYLSLSDDVTSALFYNPANLAKIRKFEVEPVNISVDVNNVFYNSANSNSLNATNLSKYVSTLSNVSQQMSSFGGSVAPSFGFPGFGFSILVDSQMAAQVNSDQSVTYRAHYQLIPALGFAKRLLGGALKLGYSLQWVNQASGTETVTSGDVSQGYSGGIAQGSGFSHNFGLLATIPMKNLPTFGLVARNVMGTSYSTSSLMAFSKTPSGVPSTDPMSIDGSFSLQPKLGSGVLMNLAFEGKDLANASGDTTVGHLAAGGEVNFVNKVFLRGGWAAGYPSAGLGLRRLGTQISFAYFTQRVGSVGSFVPDTRYMLQYEMRVN